MVIFPEMGARRFAEVELGSLIVVRVADGRYALHLKVAHDPAKDTRQDFVVALDHERWREVGSPHLIPYEQQAIDETVLDLGNTFVIKANADPNSVVLSPDAAPDKNFGLVFSGDEVFLRVLGAESGVGRRPPLWIQLSSGEVIAPSVEQFNAPSALVNQWEINLLPPNDLKTSYPPQTIFVWPPPTE